MAGKIVVDSSVLIKWIKTKDEELLAEAPRLLRQVETKPLAVHVLLYSYTKPATSYFSKPTSTPMVWKKPLRIWKLFHSSSLRPPRHFFGVPRSLAKSSP